MLFAKVQTPIKKCRGFTLIELIVVIVILGVLAAIAAPLFVDLRDEAELVKVKSTAGAFRAAVKSVQVTFNIQSRTVRVQNLPNFGQDNVDTNNIGFPIGINKGNSNENIGVGTPGCGGVWQGILNSSASASVNATSDYQTYRHTSNRVCSYVYRDGGDTAGRNSAELVIQYDSRNGQVYVCGIHSQLSPCPF